MKLESDHAWTARFARKSVRSRKKTEMRRKRPTVKQISDSRRTPTPMPEMADRVDMAVMHHRDVS